MKRVIWRYRNSRKLYTNGSYLSIGEALDLLKSEPETYYVLEHQTEVDITEKTIRLGVANAVVTNRVSFDKVKELMWAI